MKNIVCVSAIANLAAHCIIAVYDLSLIHI